MQLTRALSVDRVMNPAMVATCLRLRAKQLVDIRPALGLALRHQDLVASVLAHQDDRDKLNEIAEQAMEVAKADRRTSHHRMRG